jgi:clan AA aspartic protease
MPEPVSGVQPWVYFEDRPRSAMGEVRVVVHLVNAADDALARRGLLAPDRIRTYETTALVDTGTTRTAVPSHVAERLGLAVRDDIWVQFADARPELLGVTEPLLVDIQGRRTDDEALITGDEVLIGQTVLEKMDWFVDCRGQRLIQNPRHPDGPIFRV